ncbi:hypothetical protein ABW20_dc0106872 [Dactylellina cionopaga]|nr:hypothetical protein ABW20_dc0106872 [Dactylellina cionopaga]
MPRCAFDCMSTLSPQTGCDGGNFPCYCNNSTNIELLEACISANCTAGFGGFRNGSGEGTGNGFFEQFICSNLDPQTSSTRISAISTTSSARRVVGTATANESSGQASSHTSSDQISTGVVTNVGVASSVRPTPTTETTEAATPQFPNQPKSTAAIIGGTVGGLSALICITVVIVHKIRKYKRKKRALERLAALQGNNFGGSGRYEVNGIAGTGIDEGGQSIWSGRPVVSFILDGPRGSTPVNERTGL